MDADEQPEGAPAPAPPARRRWRRTAAVVAAFAAGSVLSGGGAVWASHQFSDVPNAHPFHTEIDWMWVGART